MSSVGRRSKFLLQFLFDIHSSFLFRHNKLGIRTIENKSVEVTLHFGTILWKTCVIVLNTMNTSGECRKGAGGAGAWVKEGVNIQKAVNKYEK